MRQPEGRNNNRSKIRLSLQHVFDRISGFLYNPIDIGERMKETKLICNKEFTVGKVDRRIFGSFLEHMGRTIYSGIYEPGHPLADEDGFRADVLSLVQKMGVTTVRYPGGNFVSCYDWRDGVGPLEARPRRLELAWRSVETNEFGINEFMRWAIKAGISPIFAVNLGTKGVENAVSLLEYCNHDKGTFNSDLRRQHGVEKPYNVQTWCLGNEMDGDWQIGHKTADEYGRLAQETAKAMKLVDPSIELVSCGSSKSSMDTFPEWEEKTLMHTYDYVDYIALHQYYDGQSRGTAAFLAQSLDLERYIHTVRAACDFVKARKRSPKTMYISVDEWGVWELPSKKVESQVEASPWQIAPTISEQIYTMEDALLFASMLMVFLKNADRVKIACQSLLTNVSACIMTNRGGEAWVQPIYYPFAHMAKYGQGEVLVTKQRGPVYHCTDFTDIPYVDSVVIHHADTSEVTFFLVNRCEETVPFCSELQGFTPVRVLEHIQMYDADKKANNLKDHNRVHPNADGNAQIKDGLLTATLQPLSWNVIRVGAVAK